MEASTIADNLKYLAENGVTLSIDERMHLEFALAQVQEKLKYEELQFWGKISGIENDYFVAVGVNYIGKCDLPQRVFFWCTNATWQFSVLPVANNDLAGIFDQIQTYFFGEHERLLVDTRGFSPFVHLAGNFAPPAKPVTELDRLSFVVHSIDNNCQIFPLGAYKKNTLGEVKKNEAFSGLKLEENFDLNSYAILRTCQQKDKQEQAARKADIFVHDFLDKVNEEAPKKVWTILADSTKTVAILRNQLWPGFFGFSRANTAVHGATYIGDGIRNTDLPFQV